MTAGGMVLVALVAFAAFVLGTSIAHWRGAPLRITLRSRKSVEALREDLRHLGDERMHDSGIVWSTRGRMREGCVERPDAPTMLLQLVSLSDGDRGERRDEMVRSGPAEAIEQAPWTLVSEIVEPRGDGSRLTMVFDPIDGCGNPFGWIVAFLDGAMAAKLSSQGLRWGKRASRTVPSMAVSGMADGPWSKTARNAAALERSAANETTRSAAPGGDLDRVARSRVRADDTGLDPQTSQAVVLSMLAVASFVWLFGLEWGLILVPVVLLHEYGHLLAYRITGKPGGRMMLLPFMGGVAVADAPHDSELERGFCAVMGPMICVPLTLAGVLGIWLTGGIDGGTSIGRWIEIATFISAALNLLNLLPLVPLDGGQVFEAFARTLAPSQASAALATLGLGASAMFYAQGWTFFALIVFTGVASLVREEGESGLRTLTVAHATALAAMYVATAAIHGAVLAWLVASGWSIPGF